MRLGLLAGGIAAVTLALVAACSDQTSEGISPGGDGGPGGRRDSASNDDPGPGDPDPEDDAGTKKDSGPNTGPKIEPKQLKAGQVALLGVIGDDVIYAAAGGTGLTLESIPIAGGSATKIADLANTDPLPIVSGGAIALYTGASEGRATLSIWTKANGLKANVATKSVIGFFVASEDGSRVAFSVNANDAGTNTPMAVTSSAAPSATAVLSGQASNQTGINIAAEGCPADIAFVGKTFFGAYCTGTSVNTTSAKLYTVADGATSPNRLDAANNNAAASVEPFWLSDKAGSKLLVFGVNGDGKVVDVAADTITTFATDIDTNHAFITDDGSAIVYKKGEALLKSTTASPPASAPIVASGVKATHGRSPDGKRVLYSTLDPVGEDETVDLRGIDFTAPSAAPVDYVTTATVSPVGFNATSTGVLYMSDFGQKGAKVKSKAASGSTEKVIGSDVAGVIVPRAGSGALLVTGVKQVSAGGQDIVVLEMGHVDSLTGGTVAPVTADVPNGEWIFKGKRMVFIRLVAGGSGSGLYSVELP